MMIRESSAQWAERIFSDAQLNDPRRTKRLVQVAATMADNIGKSIAGAVPDNAALQGAYRCINNPKVTAGNIVQAGFAQTALKGKEEGTLLALEATCTLSLLHESLADKLNSANASDKPSAMLFYNILLCSYDAEYDLTQILGLLDIQSSCVDKVSKKIKSIPYKRRESLKWQQAAVNMEKILGNTICKVISICDRESDIYKYFQYKQHNNQRFVVRSGHNYKVEENELKDGGRREVLMAQRDGRQLGIVQVEYGKVEVAPSKGAKGENLTLNYVRCTEISQNNSNVTWHLLTNEQVENKEDAQLIACYYEKLWLIEEFHKAWKSGGTNVERQRLHSKEGMEKLALILAFVAVRILQLREQG